MVQQWVSDLLTIVALLAMAFFVAKLLVVGVVVVEATVVRGAKKYWRWRFGMGQLQLFISCSKIGPRAAPEYLLVAENQIFLLVPTSGHNSLI